MLWDIRSSIKYQVSSVPPVNSQETGRPFLAAASICSYVLQIALASACGSHGDTVSVSGITSQ